MTSRNRLFAAVTLPICAAILLAGAWFAGAGSLTPPGGPVAPTMKSLSEVEPRTAVNAANTPGDADSLFKITQRGSYYLTGNITGVAGKHGIEIAHGGVTLDLNGFNLLGVAGSLDGVSVTVPSPTDIAVVNGGVGFWGMDGVDLATTGATICRVAEVTAIGNTGYGILTGDGSTVSNCLASRNAGAYGIAAYNGCTVSNCIAYLNTGIGTGNGCTFANCSAYQNSGSGISPGSGSAVSNCSAYLNTGTGIYALGNCTVSNCSAYNNVANGIYASSGSTVADCTAQSNDLDGIVCNATCIIRGNTCSFNGGGAGSGAGIHATLTSNRIEGNNCTSNDRGIAVDIDHNIIIKNTCFSNSPNWSIAIGNAVAPIVLASTNAAAISGSTYAGSLGSTDPNANFTY